MSLEINLPKLDFSALSDEQRVEVGFIKIHNKWYWTVSARVSAFLSANPTFSISTEVPTLNENGVMFRANVLDSTGAVRATGTAYERHESSAINRTSSIENCETSAVGRALAFCGWGGGEIASAEEIVTALAEQTEAVKEAHWLMMMDDARGLNEYMNSLSEAQQTEVFNSGADKRKTTFKARFRKLMAEANEQLDEEAIYIATLLKEGDLAGAKQLINELSEFELNNFKARLKQDQDAVEILNSKEFNDVPD